MEITPQFSFESDAIFQHCTYGICVADAEGVMTRVNSAFERITGLGSHHFISLHVQEAVDKGIIDESSILKLLLRKRPSTATVTTMAGKKLFSSAFPVYDKEQRVMRLATIMRSAGDKQGLKELETLFPDHQFYNPPQLRVVGSSPQIKEILNQIERLSLFDCPVLLTGETGVGKGLFSWIIHQRSSRSKGPFITLNCSTIPGQLMESELFGYEPGAFTGARRGGKPGLLESAQGGTLLLDELGELPLDLQAKLLRVIESQKVLKLGAFRERPIDVRIVASTNAPLDDMVEQGRFRKDLYYRLNVVPLVIPPLRERPRDIQDLIHHYLAFFNCKYGTNTWIRPDAVDLLTGYSWPGNVRELSNLVERLIILVPKDLIGVEDLPKNLRQHNPPAWTHGQAPCRPALDNGARSLRQELEYYEKSLLTEALEKFPRQEDAARSLSISMSTLTRKIRKYNLGRI